MYLVHHSTKTSINFGFIKINLHILSNTHQSIQTRRRKVMGVVDWLPCPNVGQASINRDLRLYPGVCFSCIVTNLHLLVI